MAKVSVIIPSYNRANLIGETIESILNQTYSNFEIIVVDDGSMDNTSEIVQRYTGVRYIYQDNAGQGVARNTGIKAAIGEFIAFLDSDDLWEPMKLEKQVSVLKSNSQIKWVYCDVEVFAHETNKRLYLYSQRFFPHKGNIARSLIRECFIASPSPVVCREVFDNVGLFDQTRQIKNSEDWEMWLSIAARYPVAYINASLARYRLHRQNITRGEDPITVFQRNHRVINNVIEKFPDVYACHRQESMSALYMQIGKSLLGHGRNQEARTMFLEAQKYTRPKIVYRLYLVLSYLGANITKTIRKFYNWLRILRESWL